MQKKNLKRGERRERKQHAIKHAFDIYWHKWGRWNDVYHAHGWWGRERVYLETEESRRQEQDTARNECLKHSKRVAENFCTCSCWMCSGYKKYEKTPKMFRERYRDIDDCDSAWDE